ncbi:MAG: alpha-2-macroglobulin family protein, partial [Chitinophagales bacterium]
MGQKITGIFFLSLVTTLITASVIIKSGDDFEGYEKEWKKVEKLESEGLPQSALQIVEKILSYARTDRNENQLVKALIYKAKFIAQTEEDGSVQAIQILENEIAKATFPLQNILYSLTAELYQSYYQQNRRQIFDRTHTGNAPGNDIRLWDITSLAERTKYLYKQSLANESALQKTPLAPYDYILQKGDKDARMLRPTLYDLLAHRALDYFVSDETYLSQPAYAFALDKEIYFADNKAFTDIQITSKDTASNKLYALDILRTLLRFHLHDPEPSALIDVDIKRLQFIWQNANVANKDSLYIHALIQAQKKYAKHPASARYSFALAQQYFHQSQEYNPFSNTAPQFDAVKALAVCDSAIQQFPGSIGADNCSVLKKQILDKSFSVETEKYNIPNEPFRALVNWKNIQQLYLKVIQLNAKQYAEFIATNYDNKLKFLAKQNVVKQWVQNLPDPADHQQHSAEIKIDKLPGGIYALMASANKNFEESDTGVSFAIFQNTSISYLSTAQEQGGNVFYILHRHTGMPLANAEIQTYRQEYNSKTKKYVLKEYQKYTTDANGIFSLDEQDGANNFLELEVRYKGDTLMPDQNVYISSAEKQNNLANTQTYFFTDRAIYRPGQTVYFKGITIEKSADGKSMRIVPDRNTTVQLLDANYQQVSALQLTTNTYGSFSGTFIAPADGLTGNMLIQNESGSQYFRVEEYKRPTFKVETKPLTDTYALGDTITIEGNAQSYSGGNIDQAIVRYRVIRETVFPWRYFDYKFIYPCSTVMEITNGVTTTDAQGNFKIQFAAFPDKSVLPESKPQFNYKIITDVTDISGETRSTVSNVNAGYISILADMHVPASIQKDSTLTIQISTTNLNNTPVNTTGTVTIYPLTAPGKLFRTRLWAQPDLYTMAKEEYYALFPHDVYGNENNMQQWAYGQYVQRLHFNTEISSSLELNTQQWATGAYKIILTTKDKNGAEIKTEKYITVTDRKKKEIIPQYLSSPQTSFNTQPGKSVNIHLNSAADDVRILLAISRPGKNTYEWYKLKDKVNVFTIPVLETDRGGITATAYLVKDNRIHEISWQIQVPWTNKQLKVELETHRNKLEPGENETWKIKISGPQGEKVAAELLASMYDKSLDVFKTHDWSFINWPTHNNTAWVNAYDMFSLAQQMQFEEMKNYYPGFRDYFYDSFNWFGFYFGYWGRGDGYYLMETVTINDSEKNKRRKSYNVNALPQPSDENFKEEEIVNLNLAQEEQVALDQIHLRSNFNEIAFFYPHLETDTSGTIIFSFTIPESLTEWKFTALAHTKDLLHGFTYSSVVTQKELMITPNMPRFLREGDTLVIAAKIQNLNDSSVTGTAQLEIFDALTMQNVDALFGNTLKQKTFSANGKQSTSAEWALSVPEGLQAITYRVKASTGVFADGEENAIPVLSNR